LPFLLLLFMLQKFIALKMALWVSCAFMLLLLLLLEQCCVCVNGAVVVKYWELGEPIAAIQVSGLSS
jgi:hypothetical protein